MSLRAYSLLRMVFPPFPAKLHWVRQHIRKHTAALRARLTDHLDLDLLQPQCAAENCSARLPGPATHRRRMKSDDYGECIYTIRDPLCDFHALLLHEDVFALKQKIYDQTRYRIDGNGNARAECGLSFCDGDDIRYPLSVPLCEEDAREWDFCALERDKWEAHMLPAKGEAMSCLNGGSEKDWYQWCCGEAAWWTQDLKEMERQFERNRPRESWEA